MSTQDPDLMATLTDEERAAMADDPDDAAALAAIAGESDPAKITGTGNDDPNATDEDDDDDGPSDPNVPPIEGKPAADEPAKPADTPAADEPATTDTPAEAEPRTQAETYRAELPADYQERVTAADARAAEISQKFADGEMDLAERDAELAKVTAEREELARVRTRVEALQDINEQNSQRHWRNQIVSFMAEAAKEQGGFDYRTDAAKTKDLDKYIKILAADDDNAERDGAWFLAEAHKLVKNKHGISTTPAAPAPKTHKQKIADAKAARKPAIDDAPKNLAAVPGSDGPGDIGDEFADVMALEGQEYEDAIARMSPQQRHKFLAG